MSYTKTLGESLRYVFHGFSFGESPKSFLLIDIIDLHYSAEQFSSAKLLYEL